MPDKRRKSRKQRRNRRRQRGGDASTWAGAVYGPAGSQTAIPGSGNLIAAQNLSGVNMCSGGAVGIATNAAPVMGGSETVVAHAPVAAPASAHVAAPTKGGRGILTDVAVPAVLLYANNVMKGRKSYGKKHRKSRRSRKFRRF